MTAASAWNSGQQGAEPGVQMPGRPGLDQQLVPPGLAPASDFLDCAKTYRTGREVCVPAGCYRNVMVTRERSPLDPGNAKQGKYYAAGFGNVKIDAVDDPEGETLDLVGLIKLSPSALDEAVAEALRLDERGYQNSAPYRSTSRAERIASAVTTAPTNPASDTGASGPDVPIRRAKLGPVFLVLRGPRSRSGARAGRSSSPWTAL